MLFQIFTPIVSAEEDMPLCNLGHLFNAYTSRLHRLEVAAYPQETLGEYHRLTVTIPDTCPKDVSEKDHAKADALLAAQEQFYYLTVVNGALHDLHLCVLGACNALGEFFTSYGGDLQLYAVQNRLRRIVDYLPDADYELAEMHPDDRADLLNNYTQGVDGQPWQPIHKEDAESLAPYTLLAEIGHYFAPLCEDRTIERIGATLPAEWDALTEEVRNYSACHPKASQLPEGAGVYRRNAAGEYEQQSVAQRVENELNDGLTDARVAGYFQQLMQRLQYVAGLAAMLTDAASYRELYDELMAIRDCTGLREVAPTI